MNWAGHMSALKLDQVLVGDCIEKMRALPAGCADLVFADPPYNMQQTFPAETFFPPIRFGE